MKNQHIFLIACIEEGNSCEKIKNDFYDEWELFNFKNLKQFRSKIFSLTRREGNEEFFDRVTDNTLDSVIVYVEHKSQNIKRSIDPSVSS